MCLLIVLKHQSQAGGVDSGECLESDLNGRQGSG